MKKESIGAVGAIISAVLATSCCLPPLLFLIFGVSFGFLGFLETLTPLRIPLSILSVAILLLSYRAYRKKCSSDCIADKRRRRKIAYIYLTLFIVILSILLYPEFAVIFLEDV